MNTLDRRILAIALPSIVSNITVPLLGLVDMAITGHMGSTAPIGAVAVGSMVFNVIYWVFGFLRMGTSGMVAQALGGRDLTEVVRLLLRSLTVAMLVPMLLVALQQAVLAVALGIIQPSAEVWPLAAQYFRICVWGAPAMLGLYALTGWFIGMQNTRVPMFVAIMQNVVNIVVSLLLVYGLGLQIEGVALGTLTAQYAGLFVALLLWFRLYGRLRKYVHLRGLFTYEKMSRFFRVNSDIFLRTLFMVAVNLYFLAAGARQGTVVLAVNTLLMQFFTLFSYVMDGFAYAGEALCGRSHGAANAVQLRLTVRRLFLWGGALTVGYVLAYGFMGKPFLQLLTDDGAVLSAAADFLPWAVLIPVTGVAAFIWDGVYIGLTATRQMLLSSVVSAMVFFGLYAWLHPLLGNHALWLAFNAFLFMRGIIQTCLTPMVGR